MKPTLLFFLLLVACVAGGTLLAYPVVIGGLVAAQPHRIATRLTQVLILLTIWPFLRALGVNNRRDLGLDLHGWVMARTLVVGWGVGVGVLSLLSLSLYLLGVRLPDLAALGSAPGALLRPATLALAAGFLIATLEELFFRGALFSAIRRRGPLWQALLGSSLLYALVHFLRPQPLDPGFPLDWSLSWKLFSSVFTGLSLGESLDSLLALFLAGLLLGVVRERSGHLGYCIGIHAGWVFVIKLTHLLTDDNPSSPYAFLAGDYDGVIGYLAAAWLGLLLIPILWLRGGQGRPPTPPP